MRQFIPNMSLLITVRIITDVSIYIDVSNLYCFPEVLHNYPSYRTCSFIAINNVIYSQLLSIIILQRDYVYNLLDLCMYHTYIQTFHNKRKHYCFIHFFNFVNVGLQLEFTVFIKEVSALSV